MATVTAGATAFPAKGYRYGEAASSVVAVDRSASPPLPLAVALASDACTAATLPLRSCLGSCLIAIISLAL